jgi:hypothetical protein
VAEPAIAAAYALFGADDPLDAIAALVSGYHAALPLEEPEIALLPALVSARLAVSVIVSAARARTHAGDPYASISEAPAWAALEKLDAVPLRFAHAALREACGLPPLAHGPAPRRLARQRAGGVSARPRRSDGASPRDRPRRRQPLPRGRPGQRRDGRADAAHRSGAR